MNYLTIQEAMKLTGKSESTFRNLARKLKASKSKDIKLEKLKTGHEKISFKESFINSYFNTSSNTSSNSYQNQHETGIQAHTLAILERELEEKNRQIESLTERLKESNYLQLQLSERVQLLEAPKKKKRWFGF